MQKIITLLALASAIAFTACDNDDKPLFKPGEINKSFGTDKGTTLAVTYSGAALTGKQVGFSTEDSKTATLTLYDIIPGEEVMTIPNVALTESGGKYAFSGSAATTRGTGITVAYSGTVDAAELTVNLDVTVPQTAWSGSYKLAELAMGDLDYGAAKPRPNVPLTGALYIDWSAPAANGTDLGKVNAVTYRGILAIILPQVLKNVSFETDGNISAQYSSDEVVFAMSMITNLTPATIEELVAKKTFQPSPKNLAYWFEKEEKLHVKLNIAAILAQAMSDSGNTDNELGAMILNLLNGDADTLKTLIRSLLGDDFSDKTIDTLLGWVKNGIPMHVRTTADGHTYVCLDKSDLDMLFTVNNAGTNDFTLLIEAVSGLIPPEYKAMVGMVKQMSTLWLTTETFSIGLDLVR